MAIKLLQKLFPASPDPVIASHQIREAALPRFAHLNEVVGDVSDYGFYTVDASSTLVVPVTTSKGIIEINNFQSVATLPAPSFVTTSPLYIYNADISTNADDNYVQITPYYIQALGDKAIPYILVTGALTNQVTLNIYNANPAGAGANQWEGRFYIFYEIKNIAQ
jgi:hypothetical protein